ncbi:hypothetical protein GOBAR_AA09458 [Gossypium barbadense]|uniref:Uncharacterized protein n=1 Tax=Gossypium barbadense TaxID=3634 RepID=A0A2P5Y6H0_GOSBA|nr:hypothetical protein GOBAR_AA09458 [Gossypium barbadense]
MLTKFISLAKLISERPQGSLPSNIESNPREQLNAITSQDEKGLVTLEPEPEPRQETEISKGKGEVDHNEQKSVSIEYKPCVPYPNATRKDRSDEQLDETITLQAHNSGNTSEIEGDRLNHSTKTDNMVQPTLQEMSLKEVHEPFSSDNRGPIHEERRLQIEELDERQTHKPRTHDKPKLCQDELNTFQNQLKVGDKVLLDAADPHIVTAKSNEEISVTVLSIFPFSIVEVSHPKFGIQCRLHVVKRPLSLLQRKGTFPNTPGPTLIVGRCFDWAVVEQVQLADAIRALLTTDPWEPFFGIIEPTYLELTMELCSTFHLQTVMTNYDDPGTVQSSRRTMTYMLSTATFIVLLRSAGTPSPLGAASYNPSRSNASALPRSLRYLHAILAHTLTGKRVSTGIVNTHNAYFLWCMLHGHVIDLAYFIALAIQHQMERHRKGAISIGPYMSLQGISSMLSIRIIKKCRGTYPPQYRIAQSTKEEALEDITDDVPPRHGDPPSQPPPPSRPVHAAASYTDISERLTRFEDSKLHLERFSTTAMSCSTTTITNFRYNILLAQDLWANEPLPPPEYPSPPSR